MENTLDNTLENILETTSKNALVDLYLSVSLNPSRKRFCSDRDDEPSSPSPLSHTVRRATSQTHRLTSTNLIRLQSALTGLLLATPPSTSDMPSSRIASPTRPSNPLHERQKLEAYKVHLDSNTPHIPA
jgi:hypothetical protein